MTKQGLSVHITNLPETPGIYLHYVCLSKVEMLAQALASEACSSSSALPPSLASPSDVAGEMTEGLAPSTVLSLSSCLWGTGKERKYRDTIHHSTRTKEHESRLKHGREEEESKQKHRSGPSKLTYHWPTQQ